MFYYRATVAYDGSGFYGMAPQKQHRTVFSVLTEAIIDAFGNATYLKYAGRTDAGVHALGQVVSFHLQNNIAPANVLTAINGRLPEDIRVMKVRRTTSDFEARHHVVSKVYRYVINTGKYDPFTARYAYQLGKNLDMKAMKSAVKLFLGKHDFLSFSSDERASTVRTINAITFLKKGPFIEIKLTGRSFLRYMVRMIVATIIEIGLHRVSVERISYLLDHPKKGSANHNAPACGLTLVKVIY